MTVCLVLLQQSYDFGNSEQHSCHRIQELCHLFELMHIKNLAKPKPAWTDSPMYFVHALAGVISTLWPTAEENFETAYYAPASRLSH